MSEPELSVDLGWTAVDPNGQNWTVVWGGVLADGQEWFEEKVTAKDFAEDLFEDAVERGYSAELIIRRRDGTIQHRDEVVHEYGEYAAEDGPRCEPARRTKKLTRAKRKRLPQSAYALPGKRYPLTDHYHATLALQSVLRVAGRHGTGAKYKKEARKVLTAVRKKFPGVYDCEQDLVEEIRDEYRL